LSALIRRLRCYGLGVGVGVGVGVGAGEVSDVAVSEPEPLVVSLVGIMLPVFAVDPPVLSVDPPVPVVDVPVPVSVDVLVVVGAIRAPLANGAWKQTPAGPAAHKDCCGRVSMI
jgi:hypothetical protein